MNLNLVFEILEIASALVNTRNAASGIRDSDVAAALLAIVRKGAQAYEEHTGEALDPSLIKAEAPI